MCQKSASLPRKAKIRRCARVPLVRPVSCSQRANDTRFCRMKVTRSPTSRTPSRADQGRMAAFGQAEQQCRVAEDVAVGTDVHEPPPPDRAIGRVHVGNRHEPELRRVGRQHQGPRGLDHARNQVGADDRERDHAQRVRRLDDGEHAVARAGPRPDWARPSAPRCRAAARAGATGMAFPAPRPSGAVSAERGRRPGR